MTEAQTAAAATLATLTRRLAALREDRRRGLASPDEVRAAEVAVCYAELELMDLDGLTP